MGMVTNSSKTVGYCRVGEDMKKTVPDQRQRVTVWKPFTCEEREAYSKPKIKFFNYVHLSIKHILRIELYRCW